MPAASVTLDLPPLRGQFLGNIDLDPAVSRFSGKELRRVGYGLAIMGDEAQQEIGTIIAAASSGETPIPDKAGGQWIVTDHKTSYSYSDAQAMTVCTYEIELTEQEALSLDQVEFEGMALVPDRWKLEADDDRIWLAFLANLNPEQHQRFETVFEQRVSPDAEDYFPVRLAGVADATIQMRFGRCLWQRLDDSAVRHRIWLMGAGGDDEAAVGGVLGDLNQPELSRTVEQAMILKAQMSALLEELQLAGALGHEAVERIRSLGTLENLPFADTREADRSASIDHFLD
jgi:hypothetical protein